MRNLRSILVSFIALAALPIACLLIWGGATGIGAVKDFYYDTKDSIIKEYGLFGSNPIYIKDDERRERLMAEQRKEYEELMAKSGRNTSHADAEAQVKEVSTDELKGSPEMEAAIKGWSLKALQNPPMSPFAQATAFLSSAKGTVQDGVDHNKLTEQDIAVITKAILSNDLKEIARLDQIYDRKNLIIEDEYGNTKRVFENRKGNLAVLSLSKKLSDELEAEQGQGK